MNERAWRALFFVAFLVASYGLLAPAKGLPSEGGLFPQQDKVEHALTFATLAVLARFAYRGSPAWGVWLALALYAAATEIAQSRIPGRDADVFDALADSVGALAAFVTRPR